MKIKSDKWHHLELVAGVAAISFSPLAVKLVSFGPSVSAFYRSFYAAVFFLFMSILGSRGNYEARNSRWLLPSITAGIFLGIDLAVWHKTIILLGAGPATFLGNSQIIFVALFAAFIFRERIPTMYYLTVALVMAGLYLLTPSAADTVGRTTGYALGLLVGFTYAGMLISLRYAKTRSGEGYDELLSLGAVFSASAIAIALYTVAVEHADLIIWDAGSHMIMMATALICQTLGWYLINSSMTKIPAHEGSLLLMLQPLLATIWGRIFFAEQLRAVQVFGIVLTLAGIGVYQWRYSAKTPGIRLGFEE